MPATPIASNTVVQFVSDDDTDDCWKSFTSLVGEANQPVLRMFAPSNSIPRFNVLLPPGQVVTIEYTTNSSDWRVLRTITNHSQSTTVTDVTATNASRFYRAKL